MTSVVSGVVGADVEPEGAVAGRPERHRHVVGAPVRPSPARRAAPRAAVERPPRRRCRSLPDCRKGRRARRRSRNRMAAGDAPGDDEEVLLDASVSAPIADVDARVDAAVAHLRMQRPRQGRGAGGRQVVGLSRLCRLPGRGVCATSTSVQPQVRGDAAGAPTTTCTPWRVTRAPYPRACVVAVPGAPTSKVSGSCRGAVWVVAGRHDPARRRRRGGLVAGREAGTEPEQQRHERTCADAHTETHTSHAVAEASCSPPGGPRKSAVFGQSSAAVCRQTRQSDGRFRPWTAPASPVVPPPPRLRRAGRRGRRRAVPTG